MTRRDSRNLGIRLGASLIAGLLALGPAAAQAPPPPARPKPPTATAPAAPDPGFEAAKAAFEALPEAERKGLQDALVWTGDYNSVITGTFGRRTFEALASFRTRAGAGTEDPLAPRLRTAILAGGEAARKAARFTVKPDPASGAVLGVPERLLTKRTAIPGGSRWQSADGRVTLESRSFKPGETGLDVLFERATNPGPDRKITYKLKRPDFVVVTGETGAGRSYIRYAGGEAGIRGFTIGYDKALAGEVDRLVIAIANAFLPFPEAAPAVAAAPVPPPPVLVREAPPAAATPSIAATGLAIAPGRVLTASAALEGCAAPRIGGAAARVLRSDPARGLALLEAPSAPGSVLPSPRPDPAGPDDALGVIGAGAGGTTLAPGTGSPAGGVVAPLQPGAAGAPAIDRAGRLAGIVARFPAAPRLVAGVAPPMSYPLIAGPAVAAFLAETGLRPAAGQDGAAASLGQAAAPVASAIVAITCPR
ncbi:serine protease [Methylobacterium durans]|uniref:serine protease n=1 Tax=Methylobacterium durans TaxID=2202825 RepID=UPI002AFEC89F|nr:serine protease [Methylobacterium durans]MEA1834512.1 serine protease [Methylobacterium durans]